MINQLNSLHTQEGTKNKAGFIRMLLLTSAKRFPDTSIHFSICYVPGIIIDPGIHRPWCIIHALEDLNSFGEEAFAHELQCSLGFAIA